MPSGKTNDDMTDFLQKLSDAVKTVESKKTEPKYAYISKGHLNAIEEEQKSLGVEWIKTGPDGEKCFLGLKLMIWENMLP